MPGDVSTSSPGGRWGRLRGHPRAVLITCCSSLLLVAMDGTVVNVALPSIRRDLGASIAGLQWVIDAYTLVAACLLMLSGGLADRFGRRHVFRIGLSLFGLGSIACGLSASISWLVTCRALQAVGGSMMNPAALSLIVHAHPAPRDRARAIGIWAAVSGLAMAVGPPLGGLLTHLYGWRSVFWINVPVIAAALVAASMLLGREAGGVRRKLDWAGQALVIVLLASLVWGLIEAPRAGWTAPRVLGAFGLSLAAICGFVAVERRVAAPLLDLSLFRMRSFVAAVVMAVIVFAALAAMLFLLPLYLQVIRGLSAAVAGLVTMPLALGAMLAAPLSGRAVGAAGLRPSMLVSGALICAGGLVCTGITRALPLGWLMLGIALFGVGFGAVNAPISSAAVAGLPMERTALAGAIASTSRQVGLALGVALVGSVAGGGVATMRPAWWAVAGVGLVVAAIAWRLVPARAGLAVAGDPRR